MLPRTTNTHTKDSHADTDAAHPSMEFMRDRIAAMLQSAQPNRIEFVYWFLLKAITG